MKSNVLLKWLLPLFIFLIAVLFLKMSAAPDRATTGDPASRLTPEEMKALGIEGDTPRDTVATLVAQVNQLRNEMQTALRDNQNQKTENDRLREREAQVETRIRNALENERSRLQANQDKLETERRQTQDLLETLRQQIEGSEADLPVEGGERARSGETLWIEPEGRASPEKHSVASTPFGQKVLSLPEAIPEPIITPAKPVYTVPTNATLIGSIAMTALIGRIPVDGTVADPYPFKIVIGAENLTANGIDLPGLTGAVASGVASGDWTLSCVRGHIRAFTFVFQDGTIRTLPEADRSGSTDKNNLGWISDASGIPCVSGERKSNAAQYLGTQSLLTAAGAGAASLIQSDDGRITYVTNGDAIGTVGITASDAMGRILANGVQDMSQWVNKLYGQAFAAIYVRPGAQVAVHLDQPLNIEFDARGRKVDHTKGVSHVSPALD
jgi:integrating conjugative element protein (TIGR03752 family)